MRTEQEMFEVILGTAKKDERIRGVYMNGSRTNPDAPRDLFQDYDIVYVVTETGYYLKHPEWIQEFGELLMIQEPDKLDEMCGREVYFERSYGYLMLFADGNRIDLHIQTLEGLEKEEFFHEPAVILLDKDGILNASQKQPGNIYIVQRPSIGEYVSCCNDFWWCLQNVAKGIWRDELPYAKKMYEIIVRGQLDKMISWWIGSQHNFNVSVGKMGKYMKRYLADTDWELYEKTYSDAQPVHFWDAIECMCELFSKMAVELADELGFTYQLADEENMKKYLRTVRGLAPKAREMTISTN